MKYAYHEFILYDTIIPCYFAFLRRTFYITHIKQLDDLIL